MAGRTRVDAGPEPRVQHPVSRPAPLWSAPWAWLKRLAGLDFTRPLPLAVLAVLYVGSRLPWITLSYGTDPDAARVAISARWFWDHGQYYTSRLPGYPIFEAVEFALYPFGATAMNTATLVVSFVGLVLFAVLLKRLRVEPKGLLTLTYAFAPMIWINSSITLDYLWGLTFILAAYLMLLVQSPESRVQGQVSRRRLWTLDSGLWTDGDARAALAGALLGVAVGCRPTSAMMALPFLVLLVRDRRWRGVVFFGAGLGVVAGLAFLPLFLHYGTSFLNFFDVRPSWKKVARTLGVEAFGLTTMIGLLLVLTLSWRQLIALPQRLRRDVHLAICLLAILLVLMSFMRLPLEEAYLTPTVPFILIGVARLLRRPAVVAVCLLIVMGSLLDVHTESTQGWRKPVAAVAGLRPEPGRVLVDRKLRQHRLNVASLMRTLPLPDRSVITAGFYYPIFVAQYPDEVTLTLPHGFEKNQIGPLTDHSEARNARDIVYVWLLRPGDARHYRRDGFRTYTMDLDGEDVIVTFETYLPEHERFAVR
jgi:hypothetical protein